MLLTQYSHNDQWSPFSPNSSSSHCMMLQHVLFHTCQSAAGLWRKQITAHNSSVHVNLPLSRRIHGRPRQRT